MPGREGPCWEGEQQAQDGAWQGRGGDAGQPTTPVDEAGARLPAGTPTRVDEFMPLQVANAVEDPPADLARVNVPGTDPSLRPPRSPAACPSSFIHKDEARKVQRG